MHFIYSNSIKKAIIALFICVSSYYSLATHIVGGEIYYDYLGNDQYKITLKVYRDCSPLSVGFDNPAYMGIFDNNNTVVSSLTLSSPVIQKINYSINNVCFVDPSNVCVEEAVYTTTVTLPPKVGGYKLVYQRCCRNGTITNISNPGSSGSTYTSTIPDPTLATNNNSPRYTNFPPIFLCNNAPLKFDHSATDTDGDSIAYELCTPLDYANASAIGNTAPVVPYPPFNINVPYSTGYSSSNPMNGNPPLSINPTTGELTITPNTVGQFVVGVCANEYRNGNLINTTKRDFQFNVINCQGVVVASVPNQTFNCVGKTVAFENNTDTSAFHTTPFTWLWNFGVPSLTNDTSRLFKPTYNFPDTGKYTITLIVNPGTICADTGKAVIAVYQAIYVDFNVPTSQCLSGNSYSFASIDTLTPGAAFIWNFENATPATSTAKNPTGIKFNGPGKYKVTLNALDNGCNASSSDSVTVDPMPVANFSYTPTTDCAPYQAYFYDSSKVITGTITNYLWDFGHGLSSTQKNPSVYYSYENKGVQNGSLLVTTNKGCTDFKTFVINDSTCNITVPNVFTPNGDGVNPTFSIYNLEHYPKSRLEIYNRWGLKLYESADYQNDWDGKNAPDGTYYFILYVRDGRTIPGYFSILRN